MLIGLRLLLVVALIATASFVLGYLFTRNPRFLKFAKTTILVTLVFAALIGGLYVVERLLLA